MRLSTFWALLDEEFGRGYARSLAAEHVLGGLGGLTPVRALEGGEDPARVWMAICVDFDVPPERRLGKDRPPRKRPTE